MFDFTNSADDININNGISLGTVHSVNFWVNFAAPYSTRDAYILSSGTVNGWVVYATNGGLLYYKAGSSTYSSGTMTAPTAAGVGKWHNITITRNGANINFYQNGNTTPFATTSSFAGASTALGDIDFISGDRSYGSDIRYSNFTFYDIELSPAQVEQAYNNGSPLSTPVQQSNLKAWYKLNATSNYAGLNPNFHNALSFDGSSSQYVIAPLDGKGTGSSPFASGSDLEFTVSFWYFRESSSSQIGVFQWAIPLSSGNPFLLVQQNSNDLKVYYDNNYRTTTTTTTNGWYNITMTRTSSDNIFKAYLNGVEFISYDDGGTIVNQSNAESVYFGNGYNGYFTGKISNAAVWTQAISAEDVLYLYNGGTPQTSLSFEPLSWWKLDNLTTGIQDSGSASNNGTNNGATAVSSSVAVDQWNFDNVSQAQTPNWSSALDFVSSSTQYIDLTNTGFPTGAASRTVSAWIKADSSGQNNEQGIIKYGTTSTRQLFMMSLAATTGQLRVSTYGDDLTYTTADLRDDTWHHVALTYDGTSIKGYVDGSYVGVETNTLVNTSNNSPAIGNWNGAGFTFNGAISNVILYTETLTDANILALYNNGSPQSTPYGSPFGWWKLDNTASGINDSGSGGNNGTLQNAPTEIQTNVWTPRLNGESTTLPSTALVSSDLQFESPYSNFSLDFDAASSNYIDCTTNLGDTLGVVTNLSVSMWIKADVTSGNDFTFNIGSFSNSYGMVALQLLSNNLYIRLNDNARYLQKSFSSNDWNNIIFVYDGSNVNNTYLYINGEKQTLDGSGGVHPTSLDLSGLKTIIGAGYSSSYSFDGKIDETAIWSSALTQAQVSQVYNNGYPADLTSLSPVSWWRLGEDAYFVSPNFTVPNQITGAPNGTSANMDQADLVADAPGSYASGVGSSLALADRVGDAPESTANSLSFNMTPLNKISYPSGYVPTQADNVYSMAFDGVSDYFNLGTSLNSTINGVVNNFSISCWIKADTGSGSVRRGIIGNYTTASATGFYLDLINSSANAFTLRAGYHGASGYNLRDNTTTLVANGSTWYNVIVTVSGNTSGDVVVYINGIAENGTTIFSSPSSYTVTANLEVGHIAHGPSNRFSGDIDEVAIFDYALSPRQIKTRYLRRYNNW